VLGQQPLGADRVLAARAAELGTTLVREGLDFGVARRRVAVGGRAAAQGG